MVSSHESHRQETTVPDLNAYARQAERRALTEKVTFIEPVQDNAQRVYTMNWFFQAAIYRGQFGWTRDVIRPSAGDNRALGPSSVESILGGTDQLRLWLSPRDIFGRDTDTFVTDADAGQDLYLYFGAESPDWSWRVKAQRIGLGQRSFHVVDIFSAGRMRGDGPGAFSRFPVADDNLTNSWMMIAHAVQARDRQTVWASRLDSTDSQLIGLASGASAATVTLKVRHEPAFEAGVPVRFDGAEWSVASIERLGRRKWMLVTLTKADA